LLIQHLCSKKDIFLLWSTGQGVIFTKFQISPQALENLDILLDLARHEKIYSAEQKKQIIQEIINSYSPFKLPQKIIN
jgi:hypothetical protein